MTDPSSAVETATLVPLAGWQRRRDVAGQVLEFSAQLVRPRGSAPAAPGRIRQAAGLALSLLPRSIDSHRSIWSLRSMYSGLSIQSMGSLGSVLSAGSIGSALSIASVGSVLSIGSAGSILSIGSAGSILSIGSTASTFSIGGLGRRTGPWAGADSGATVRHLGTVAGTLALLGALRSS